MKGKVWLTGAGPSDVELFTLKAKRVLEQAEVVVYDSLVGKGILAWVPAEAEKIDVGKRAGNHKMSQEQISQVLVDKALEGKKVVRLKGGDPFLFGRGGEEAELLQQNQIPYEIIPGVTSAISVPAYAGIPVTHRDAASMIHIITGHKRQGEALNMPFEALVQATGTLIFLMGIAAVGEICQGLIDAGMDAMTPAAIVSNGTTGRQSKVRASLAEMKELVAVTQIPTPGILVVGEVCSYDELLDWRKDLPLNGNCFYITRPKERSSMMAAGLRELGAEVVELPAIQTVPITPNEALSAALQQIGSYQLAAFTSPAGVEYFFDFLRETRTDIRAMMHLKFAVIGSGTKKELEKYGILADYMPKVYDGEALGTMIGELEADIHQILIPRAEEGNPLLVEEIKKRRPEAVVTDISVYRTLPITETALDVPELIRKGELQKAVFTSASTVRGFMAQAAGEDLSGITAYCIGNMTAEEAQKAGMKCLVSKEASIDSLISLIREENEK